MGYSETFIYRYLNDMGASSLLLGLTVTVGAGLEVLLMLGASAIIARLGTYNVLAAGLLCFSAKFCGKHDLLIAGTILLLCFKHNTLK